MTQQNHTDEFPRRHESDYENWVEYRNGRSQHQDIDDEDWQNSFFLIFAESQTQKLRKFLKFKPEEKRELSRKVKFNLTLMDISEKLGKKAWVSFLLIMAIAFYAEETGSTIQPPVGLVVTWLVCVVIISLTSTIQKRLPVSFYPYLMGKMSHLFADCRDCMGNGVSEQMTCRTCNGIGMMVYFGDPHYAYTDEGLPRLDERERLIWNPDE